MVGRLVLSTYSEVNEASRSAKMAVERRFAACANLIPIRSIYTWKGRVEDDNEILVLYKTTSKKARALRRFIEETHGYEVPEVVEVEMRSVSKKYMDWLTASTS